MSAAITDKFKKGYGFFSTTLSAQKNSGASSMSLSDATGVPTTTGLVFTVGRVNSSGTLTPSTRAIYKGTLSGTTVSNLTLTEGTDQTHAAGTVVEITFTATHWNDVIDGITAEHKQTGAHSAITADSIVVADAGTLEVDTINEATAAAGVTIDGMQIKDNLVVGASGKGIDNTSLNTAAGKLGGAWSDWSPSYVNITVGNGTVVAKYNQIGKTVHVYFNLTFGSTTSITSNNTISLPVTASSDYVVAEGNLMGAATFHDATGNVNVGAVRLQSTTTILPIVYGAAGSYANESGCTATTPYTWTTSDKLNFTFSYQAA